MDANDSAGGASTTGKSSKSYLTKGELARACGLSESTIQRYKDQRLIPFFQPGGKGAAVRFPLNAIEAVTSAALLGGAPMPAQGAQGEPSSKTVESTAGHDRRPVSGPRPKWRTDSVRKLLGGESN
jgi:hypothetical protein